MNSVQTLDKHSTSTISDEGRRNLLARGLFLAAALLSFVLSVTLFFAGEQPEGIFVGLWVPSILALGAFLSPRYVPPANPVRGGERQ